MHFEGKVIWITGASSGIGAALAAKLATQRAVLILTARNVGKLDLVREQCLSHTSNCHLLAADLLIDDLKDLIDRAISLEGHIDIHISCAGVSQRSFAFETDMAVFRQLMEVNFFAPAALCKYLLTHFISQGHGHFVAIGSMAGLMGFPMRSGYVAAKHAMKGFIETIQIENQWPSIYYTLVSPGRINTPISLSALTGTGTPHNRIDSGQLHGIPVSECAQKIIRGVELRKKHVIIARGERILYWFWWFWPRAYRYFARKAGQQ